MSYYEVQHNAYKNEWKTSATILCIIALLFIQGIQSFDYGNKIKQQRQEIINLTAELEQLKAEYTKRDDFLYKEMQTLAYQTDVLAQSMNALSE